jgi:hypothetical protein
MGLGYAPRLQRAYDVGIDDTKVINLVLREMHRKNDPRLNPSWKLANIGGALGGVIQFDWRAYERAARDTYFGVWRREPAQAFLCYAWYKPSDLAWHTLQAGRLVGKDLIAWRATPLAAALAIVAGLLVMGRLKIRGHPEENRQIRTLLAASLCLLGFSTVPAFVFYAAMPTLSGFYVTLPVCLGLFALVTRHTKSQRPMVVVSTSRFLSHSRALYGANGTSVATVDWFPPIAMPSVAAPI